MLYSVFLTSFFFFCRSHNESHCIFMVEKTFTFEVDHTRTSFLFPSNSQSEGILKAFSTSIG